MAADMGRKGMDEPAHNDILDHVEKPDPVLVVHASAASGDPKETAKKLV